MTFSLRWGERLNSWQGCVFRKKSITCICFSCIACFQIKRGKQKKSEELFHTGCCCLRCARAARNLTRNQDTSGTENPTQLVFFLQSWRVLPAAGCKWLSWCRVELRQATSLQIPLQTHPGFMTRWRATFSPLAWVCTLVHKHGEAAGEPQGRSRGPRAEQDACRGRQSALLFESGFCGCRAGGTLRLGNTELTAVSRAPSPGQVPGRQQLPRSRCRKRFAGHSRWAMERVAQQRALHTRPGRCSAGAASRAAQPSRLFYCIFFRKGLSSLSSPMPFFSWRTQQQVKPIPASQEKLNRPRLVGIHMGSGHGAASALSSSVRGAAERWACL